MGSVSPSGVISPQSQNLSPLPQTKSSQSNGRTFTDHTHSKGPDGAPGEACEATNLLSIKLPSSAEEFASLGTKAPPLAEREITDETSVAPPVMPEDDCSLEGEDDLDADASMTIDFAIPEEKKELLIDQTAQEIAPLCPPPEEHSAPFFEALQAQLDPSANFRSTGRESYPRARNLF